VGGFLVFPVGGVWFRNTITVLIYHRHRVLEKEMTERKVRAKCRNKTFRGHRENPMDHLPSTSPPRCYTSPTRELPYIPLQSPGHSVHRKIGSDNYMITFVSNRGFQTEGAEQKYDSRWGVKGLRYPHLHNPWSFYSLNIILTVKIHYVVFLVMTNSCSLVSG
jgi:hypothetical protein